MSTVYQPGVCNIGAAEIRRRRAFGVAGAVLTIAVLAVFIVAHVPGSWRLLIALPAAGAATSLLQAELHFCVHFGMSGLFNFGEQAGKTDSVHQAAHRKADRRMALRILAGASLIGLAVAGAAMLLP